MKAPNKVSADYHHVLDQQRGLQCTQLCMPRIASNANLKVGFNVKGGGAAPSREECQSQACFRQAENAQGRASPATERQPTIVAASSGSLGLSLSGVIRTCSNGWAGPLVWYSTKLEIPASRQNPLQCAAMHLETPRSFRHVVCARFVNLQYVLPAHLSRRHRTRWRLSSHCLSARAGWK